ncbi:MAG: peptidylprolyl isomerase, partial [Pirellulales bacterium]|nr:peptidylprolyl isomerase [Pirellulales bacterium]
MSAGRKWFGMSSKRRRGKTNTTQRPFRRARIEALEPRQLLSASPTLAEIGDVTLYSGSPLHIPLDAADDDGDNLNFSVSISNENILNEDLTVGYIGTQVLEGNRSMKISVAGYGDMVLELFEGRAPRATERIITLAESGFYDGVIFHRVINGFMIQGGDPTGTGSGGSDLPDFDDQFHFDLQHNRSGVLSMAKSTDDTNNSQFFITEGPTRHLDYNHTIFGQLVEGEDVREAISNVPVNGTSPQTPVVMESVEIFYDNENGVLMLSAPEGASGTVDVTVTVDDGNSVPFSRTFHVTVEPDVTPGLGPNEIESLNANPFLDDIDPVYVPAGAGSASFTLSVKDADGELILTDELGTEYSCPPLFMSENYQIWLYQGMPDSQYPDRELIEVEGLDIPVFSHTDLDYWIDIETGEVTVWPTNGLVGLHLVSVAVTPRYVETFWGLVNTEPEEYGWRKRLLGVDAQAVPVIIQPTEIEVESRLEMKIVQTPTATDYCGEVDELPENVDWMDEWESFSVEIWASTDNNFDMFGIHTAAFDLEYNDEYFTATEIEYGKAFDREQTGSLAVDGVVSNIGGSTAMYRLSENAPRYPSDPEDIVKFGDDKRVLVARVHFEPNATGGGVPMNSNGGYVSPITDLGLSIQNAAVELNVGTPAALTVAPAPAVYVWPMMYDNDDNGNVGLGDLAFFAA